MKNKLSTLSFLVFLATALNAQSGLNMFMKTGFLIGKMDVANPENLYTQKKETRDENTGSLSLGFSLPIKNNFRFGTEIGYNTFGTFLELTDASSSIGVTTSSGHYRFNQLYFAFVPEYRILKSLYINAGTGFVSDFSESYTSGYRISPNNPIENIQGYSYGRANHFHYFAGVGFCPNITNELALLAEVRYVGNPANAGSPEATSFGFNAFNLNFGIMYKPK